MRDEELLRAVRETRERQQGEALWSLEKKGRTLQEKLDAVARDLEPILWDLLDEIEGEN